MEHFRALRTWLRDLRKEKEERYGSSPLLSGPETVRSLQLLFALPLSQVVNEEFPCGGTLVAFLIAPLENPAC